MSRRLLLAANSLAIVVMLVAFAQAQDKKKPRPRIDRAAGGRTLRPAEESILKKLDEPTTFNFAQVPLLKVVASIRDKHHIPVVLDTKAVADLGLKADEPITISVSDIPLRSAIELALGRLGMTWTIHDSVLFITSCDTTRSTEFMIVRSYDVSDFLVTYADLAPFDPVGLSGPSDPLDLRNMSIPTQSMHNSRQQRRLPQVPNLVERTNRVQELVDIVTMTIAPQSWDEVGGTGSIQSFDQFLVVSNSLEVHGKVESLLADLRAKRRQTPTLVVDLQWVWLDKEQAKKLLGGADATAGGRAPAAVDAKTLESLSRDAPGFRGRLTCANGQVASLVSADQHTAVLGAATDPGVSPGVQPVTAILRAGVGVAVRASVAPGETTALLEVQSGLSRRGKPRPLVRIGANWSAGEVSAASPVMPGSSPISGAPSSTPPGGEQKTTHFPAGSISIPIERINYPMQQLTATARVPLGKPVVVGAMTFAFAGDTALPKDSQDAGQLFLVATTSLATPSTAAKPAQRKK